MESIEIILQNIEQKNFVAAKEVLSSMNAPDIASFLCDVDSSTMLLLFRILPKGLAAEVFAFLSPYTQQLIVSSFSDTELSTLLQSLFVDDLADLIEEMPSNVAGKILKNATEDTRKIVNQILQYPENSTGSILTTEYIKLKKILLIEYYKILVLKKKKDLQNMLLL